MPREKLLRKSPQRIGELFLRRGWIQAQDLSTALEVQAKSSVKKVGEILKEMGKVTEDQVATALAEQYHLPFLDLHGLESGWQIAQDVYSFKCKHLHILPMRDPQGTIWIVVSDVTIDEKLEMTNELVSSRVPIKFAVSSSTPQGQIFEENPPRDEPLETERTEREVAFPPRPVWISSLASKSSGATLDVPAGDRGRLGLEAAAEPLTRAAVERSLDALSRATPPTLMPMTAGHLAEALGLLLGVSAMECRRRAHVDIGWGPRFSLRVNQIIHASEGQSLPKGYVHTSAELVGRDLAVEVTVPWACREEPGPELFWPSPWPPPDLEDSLAPLFDQLCRIPAFLKRGDRSLRWMGNDSPARRELNKLCVATLGVSLGHAKIDDLQEMWEAVRARYRCLHSNDEVRKHWSDWKGVSLSKFDITPGTILACTALLLNARPELLGGNLKVVIVPGDAFGFEIERETEGITPLSDPLAGIKITVSRPPYT